MAENHTRLTVRANGDANSYALLDGDGNWLLSVLHNGEALPARQAETLRRLAACWNFCLGAPTDWLEGWNAADTTELFGDRLPIDATLREWMERATTQSQRASAAEAQRDELLDAIEEWWCPSCRTVFQRGHVRGLDVSCDCGQGILQPSSLNQRLAEHERDAARAQRDVLMLTLRRCVEHMEWSTPAGKAAYEVAAALVTTHQHQSGTGPASAA